MNSEASKNARQNQIQGREKDKAVIQPLVDQIHLDLVMNFLFSLLKTVLSR